MPEFLDPRSFPGGQDGGSLLDLILGRRRFPPGWPYVLYGAAGAGDIATAGAPAAPSAATPGAGSDINAAISAILGPQQAPKRRPLDYLVMAASPLVAGLTQSLLARRRDSGRAFAAGALGQGFNVLAGEAARPRRQAEENRRRIIEQIILAERLQKIRREGRGAPISGETPEGQPAFVYPGTGEIVPGVRPRAEKPAAPTTRERTLPGGEIATEVWNPEKRVFEPAESEIQRRVPIMGGQPLVDLFPGQGGATERLRVPFVSRPKPEKAVRQLRQGKEGKFYWVSPGQQPVYSGLEGRAPEGGAKESEIKRRERQVVNEKAMGFLDEAFGQLGEKKQPHEYTNRALDLFNQAARKQPALRKYAKELTGTIRAVGSRARSADEVAALMQAIASSVSAEQ